MKRTACRNTPSFFLKQYFKSFYAFIQYLHALMLSFLSLFVLVYLQRLFLR